MMIRIFSLFLVLIFIARTSAQADTSAGFEQLMPDCVALSKLWVTQYHKKLKAKWPLRPLICDGSTSFDLAFARGAYMLDETNFFSIRELAETGQTDLFIPAQSPPPSMLDWVSMRITATLIDPNASYPATDTVRGKIYVPLSMKNNTPVEVAGQLIHEARHAGFPAYLHVECLVGPVGTGSCDPGLAENFESAGSHAIAALWLSWVARRSFWPNELRYAADWTVKWVLENRINASNEDKDLWKRKYLSGNEPTWEKSKPMPLTPPFDEPDSERDSTFLPFP